MLVDARIMVHGLALIRRRDRVRRLRDVRRLHELGVLPVTITRPIVVVFGTEVRIEQLGRVYLVPSLSAIELLQLRQASCVVAHGQLLVSEVRLDQVVSVIVVHHLLKL